MTPGRTALLVRPLGYTAMRMLRLRAALTDFLRRWGIYLAIVVVLFGAGSNAPLTIAAGLAAMFVWPLRLAAMHGPALVPMTLAYAAVGTLPVMLTRPLWWPRRWAAAEHALPLAPGVIRRSDRWFALVMMTPWQTVLVVGGVGAWLNDDAVDASARWWALGGWALATVGSLQLSLLWMRGVRRRAVATRTPSKPVGFRGTRIRQPRAIRPLGARRALVLMPMLRGRAQRTVLASLGGSLATIAGAVVPRWAGLSIGWTFAFASLAMLCATSVSRTSTVRELRPLWDDHPHLPLDGRPCERIRILLTLSPLVAGEVACLLVATLTGATLRPQVCVIHGAIVVAGCVLEALTPRTLSPSDHAARWVLMLVAAIAFASEVSPA